MKKRIITCSLLSLLSLPVAADVKLELPKEVSILSINGEDGRSGLLSFVSSHPDQITLPNGQNQIVYEIQKIYNKGSSQGKKYRSAPQVLSFNSVDEKLTMTIPPLASYESAQKFDKSISISLKNTSGASIDYTNEKLPLDGFSLSRNYANLLASYNQSKNINTANINANNINPPTQKNITSSNYHEQQTSSSKLITLKNVYNQMSEEEKQEFLSWAIKNIN
ncbi:DUF2057 domain-containing protein [uncultured Photobacterium sp.]|uniref:DUF2057 domain-containing protein n=1 Tax=uncultured Photobacterium sp. TaxID=173973 RepID=UPI0026331B58|nr:DUF2057 domain-containing protein [uncultured Photobacterium sp.]